MTGTRCLPGATASGLQVKARVVFEGLGLVRLDEIGWVPRRRLFLGVGLVWLILPRLQRLLGLPEEILATRFRFRATHLDGTVQG